MQNLVHPQYVLGSKLVYDFWSSIPYLGSLVTLVYNGIYWYINSFEHRLMTIPQNEYTIHVGHVIWLTMVVSNGSQYDYFGTKWKMFLVQIVMCIVLLSTLTTYTCMIYPIIPSRPFPPKEWIRKPPITGAHWVAWDYSKNMANSVGP